MALYFDKQRNKWVADYSVSINNQRVRKRKYFKAKHEAKACLVRQKEQKQTYGQSSEFDIKNYQRLKSIEAELQGGTIEQAVRHFNATIGRRQCPTLSEAIEEYLQSKECSAAHLVNLRIYLNKLLINLGDRAIVEIQAFQIYEFLQKLAYSPVYKNNMRRAYVTFFNHCIFKQYIEINEAEKVPLFKEQKADIECISVENTKKLFKVLTEDSPHLIPFNALRAFAGIRTEHAKTMNWEQINLAEKGIRFSGGGKRVISYLENYPDNLWAWLQTYKNQKLDTSHARETGKIMKAYKIDCPHNGLRHGFATYHLAQYKDVSLTSILLMHKGNPRMLFDRYRGVATACASAEYFSILPT